MRAHRAGFAQDCAVDSFGAAILSGCVWGSDCMGDAKGGTPVSHGIGNQFAIIGDERLEGKTTLCRHMFVP